MVSERGGFRARVERAWRLGVGRGEPTGFSLGSFERRVGEVDVRAPVRKGVLSV